MWIKKPGIFYLYVVRFQNVKRIVEDVYQIPYTLPFRYHINNERIIIGRLI